MNNEIYGQYVGLERINASLEVEIKELKKRNGFLIKAVAKKNEQIDKLKKEK